jgi:N utilization substance protein B
MLFQLEFSGEGPTEEFFNRFWQGRQEPPEVRAFAQELVRGTWDHRAEIDALLEQATEHWQLQRLAAVDRNILRFATYEILYREDIPPAVSIDEALEVAKKFSMRESAAFINGVLDRVARLAGKV